MSRRMRTITLPLIAMVAIALPSLAGKPDRYRREVPVRPFAITWMDADLGMEYHYYGENSSGRGGGRVRYSNHYLQEYFEGRMRGYIYHPRLLEYSSSVRLGLAQQRLRRNDDAGSSKSEDNDELLGYDIRLDILKDHRVSGTVRSMREERMLMGLFVDRYRTEVESHSATLRWREKSFDADLTATHAEIDEFGIETTSHSERDTVEANLHHRIGDRVRTDLQYRWQTYDRHFRSVAEDREYESNTDLQTQDLNLTNRIDFDRKRQSFLRSSLRIHDQKNNTDLRSYRWKERLQLQHRPNLRTYLEGSYSRNENNGNDTETYRAEAGTDFTIYRSLRNHFDVHGRRTDYGSVTEDRYGATGRIGYRKQTYAGVLSASYARTLDMVERDGAGGNNEIFDEPATLGFGATTYLDSSDIIESSIVVTDAANEVVYIEGFDFDVVREGRRTGLKLRPGGNIADGQTVYVDYSVELTGKQSYLSDDEDMSLRHDFDKWLPGFSVYARRHVLNARNADEGFDDSLEYTDSMIGARQEWRDFAASVEFQDYNEETGGYEQWRTQVEGSHYISSRLRWGWNVGMTQTRYDTRRGDDDDDRSDYYFASVNANGTFAKKGYWSVEGRSMVETGRTERTINGILGRIGLEWRKVSIEGGGRLEQYDVDDSEKDRMQAFIRIKRKLGPFIAKDRGR